MRFRRVLEREANFRFVEKVTVRVKMCMQPWGELKVADILIIFFIFKKKAMPLFSRQGI